MMGHRRFSLPKGRRGLFHTTENHDLVAETVKQKWLRENPSRQQMIAELEQVA